MNIQEFVMKIRGEFESMISQKTGWGKNEIMIKLDSAIAKVSLESLRDCVKK